MAFVEFTQFTPEIPDGRKFPIEANDVVAIGASTSQTRDEITEIYVSGWEVPFMVEDDYEGVKDVIRGAREK
jgi:hypothetical protein